MIGGAAVPSPPLSIGCFVLQAPALKASSTWTAPLAAFPASASGSLRSATKRVVTETRSDSDLILKTTLKVGPGVSGRLILVRVPDGSASLIDYRPFRRERVLSPGIPSIILQSTPNRHKCGRVPAGRPVSQISESGLLLDAAVTVLGEQGDHWVMHTVAEP